MARPRKNAPGKTATQRMEDAFWTLLEKEKFSDITIADLASKAKVNHNTFYYYFDNLEDMASECFENNMVGELLSAVVALIRGELSEDDFNALPDDVTARFKRACRFARGDALQLVKIFKDFTSDALFAAAGKDVAAVTIEDLATLDFSLGGFIALLNSSLVQKNPLMLVRALQKEPGATVTKSLRSILDS